MTLPFKPENSSATVSSSSQDGKSDLLRNIRDMNL